MAKRLAKRKASDPKVAVYTTPQGTLIDQLVDPENLSKIDTKCSCPPTETRCPPQRKKITTRMVIPESEIVSSIGGPLFIDQIEIGTMTIPSLRLDDFRGNFTYGSVKAKNVELTIKHSINTTFTGRVDLPWPFGWKKVRGGVDLDTFQRTYKLGDMNFQGGSFSMLSPTTNISPFSMEPDPIRSTTIGEVVTNDVKMKCTIVPLDTPLGVNVGICFPLQNPMRPNNVITEETNIQKMESKKILSPRLVVKNIKASNVTIPSVTTDPFTARSTTPVKLTVPNMKMYGTGVHRSGHAKRAEITGNLTVNIEEVIMKVKGGLEFTNLKGTVTTASAISNNLDVNLVMKGIKIKGLNFCGMKIPKIEVVI